MTRRFPIFIILMLAIVCHGASQTNRNDSLLRVLDKVILEKEVYVTQKENRIQKLKLELLNQQTTEQQYYITSKLIEEYTAYISDSAFTYIDHNKSLAAKTGKVELFVLNEITYSELLSSVGLFTEAKEILDSIDESTLNNDVMLIKYYLAQELYYSCLYDYNQNERFSIKLKDNIVHYYKKLYHLLPDNVPLHYLYKYRLEIVNKDYDKAIVSIQTYKKILPQDSRSQAISNYLLSEAYRMKGDIDEQQKYLILSAIEDIKSVTKENRAIFGLANILYSKGDIRRSYRYIQSAMTDANFYDARFRNVQITKILPIIEKAYEQQIDTQNIRLQYLSAGIAVFCIILLSVAIVIYKQSNKLKKTRYELLDLNSNLKTMSENQKELIKLQKQLNEELELKNKQIIQQSHKLSAANQVKDEYLKQFLQMCATYIKKLSEYQINVNRKIKTGQINDLLRTTSSTQFIINEKKELYQKFDQAFLHLYPDFISQLNLLLKEDERFPLTNGTILDNDLRILALIRLGIKESSQIASFLGFTSQTMYTYRTKLRDKAIDRDNFDENIMNINSANV